MSPGDILQLGNHRLACGSSSDTELVAMLLNGEKANLVLCDPPYGVNYVESKQGVTKLAHAVTIENDNIMDDAEYQAFTNDWLAAIKPHLARKNSLYIFNSDKMMIPTIQGLRQSGGKFTQLLIWAKTQSIIGRMDYLPQHELIIYGWYGTHGFMKGKDKSVLVYPKPSSSNLHPTMKPIGLLRRLLLNSSQTGDVVYDGFGGSGSTLIACEQTARICYMVELDPNYCEVIAKRWESVTGKKRVILHGHQPVAR
jgi:DNA modification methylase